MWWGDSQDRGEAAQEALAEFIPLLSHISTPWKLGRLLYPKPSTKCFVHSVSLELLPYWVRKVLSSSLFCRWETEAQRGEVTLFKVVMVNLMWYPDSWLDIILGVSVGQFLSEINI